MANEWTDQPGIEFDEQGRPRLTGMKPRLAWPGEQFRILRDGAQEHPHAFPNIRFDGDLVTFVGPDGGPDKVYRVVRHDEEHDVYELAWPD